MQPLLDSITNEFFWYKLLLDFHSWIPHNQTHVVNKYDSHDWFQLAYSLIFFPLLRTLMTTTVWVFKDVAAYLCESFMDKECDETITIGVDVMKCTTQWIIYSI
jgi:hypothetical protein